MVAAVDAVVVELGLKGALDASSRSADTDPGAAVGHAGDGETLILEPAGDGGEVALAKAETVGELFGGEPAAVVGGAGSALGDEEGLEIGLLIGGGAERESNVGELCSSLEAAGLILRGGEWVDVAGEDEAARVVDACVDSAGLGVQRA